MTDDMEGLFSHASGAYRAGQKAGRDELFTAAMIALGFLSHGYEKSDEVEAFRATESACKTLHETNDALNKPRTL